MDEYVVTTNGIDAWPTKRIRFRSLKLSKSWKITIVRRFVATNFKDNFARKYRDIFLGKSTCKLFIVIVICIIVLFVKNIIQYGSLSNLNEWKEQDSEICYIRNERVITFLKRFTFPLLIVYFFFENMKLEGTLEISYWKPTVNITNSIRIIPIPSSLR